MTVAIAKAWADAYNPPPERSVEMARLYVEQGLTLQEIGDRYGITRERVRQLIKPFGLEGHYGRRKREERVRMLMEAYARIESGESTSLEEAKRLGYSSRTTFAGAINGLGLKLRKPIPEEEHGTSRKYHKGCRCDECRRAHREDLYAWRERRGVKEHGLASSYVNYGCRCPACREAVRIQRRAAKARKRQAQESTD